MGNDIGEEIDKGLIDLVERQRDTLLSVADVARNALDETAEYEDRGKVLDAHGKISDALARIRRELACEQAETVHENEAAQTRGGGPEMSLEMSVDIQRDCAAVNSSFIHSQRMFAALRLFCKHGDTGGFAKPFWSALDGFAYACNRHCAIRVKADLLPLEAAPSDVSHAKTIALFKLYGTEKGTPIGIDLQDLYEAAEVSIAISRGRNGMMDGNVFDERSDMAFVSVPGVGVYRADYLFDAYRASVLTNCLSTRVSRRDHVGKGNGSFILGIGDSSGCEVLICPMHGGNVRDSRWVVVEAGTLRERVERSFDDIVGVAK